MPNDAIDSAAQLTALADEIDLLAMNIDCGPGCPDPIQAFEEVKKLVGAAERLRLMSMSILINSIDQSLEPIIEATQEASKVINTIKKVQQLIEVVGDVLMIVVAINAQKWQLVWSGVNELKNDVAAYGVKPTLNV